MKKLLEGVRTGDIVLALILTAFGAALMVENIVATAADIESEGFHALSSQSWLMIPVFAAATLPIMWRRRNLPVVLAVTAAALAVHVLAFGWIIRCGVGLPLSFALAYACGRLLTEKRDSVLGLLAVLGIQVIVLVRDAAAGIEILPFTAVIGLMFWGVGVAIARASARKSDAGQAVAEPAAAVA